MTLVPTSYTEVGLYMMLAVGAALFLGTGAALLRYRRTGLFPGEEEALATSGESDPLAAESGPRSAESAPPDAESEPRNPEGAPLDAQAAPLGAGHGDPRPPGVTRTRVRAALVKCGVGAVLTVWALGTIVAQRGG